METELQIKQDNFDIPLAGIDPGKIGFDFDGVIADTMAAFIRLAAADYAVKVVPGEITEFMV